MQKYTKKILGFGNSTTRLLISNEEDIMKTVESHKNSGLISKWVT